MCLRTRLGGFSGPLLPPEKGWCEGLEFLPRGRHDGAGVRRDRPSSPAPLPEGERGEGLGALAWSSPSRISKHINRVQCHHTYPSNICSFNRLSSSNHSCFCPTAALS